VTEVWTSLHNDLISGRGSGYCTRYCPQPTWGQRNRITDSIGGNS